MTNYGPIIVTGMHRSGTSMLMSILCDSGMNCGSPADFLDASDENPKGYWENKRIISFNEKLLEKLGGSWKNIENLSSFSEMLDMELGNQKKEAQLLLKTIFDNENKWILKDPRFMLLLPFWRKLFPNLKVVLCVRNPIEVALSLSNRISEYHTSFSQGIQLWHNYHELFFNNIENTSIIYTHFNSYFYNAEKEANRIFRFLGRDINKELNITKNFVSSFRHYDFSPDVLNKYDPSGKMRDYYLSLCANCGESYQQALRNAEPINNEKKSVEITYATIQNVVKLQSSSFSYFQMNLNLKQENNQIKETLLDIRKKNSQITKENRSLEKQNEGLLKKCTFQQKTISESNNELATKQDELDSVKETNQEIIREHYELEEKLTYFESVSGLLNTQLQGILESRTWVIIEKLRHYVGKIFPFLLHSPYRKVSVSGNVSKPLNLSPGISIYANINPQKNNNKILYIYPADDSLRASCIYRVHNMVEYLELNGNFLVEACTSLEIQGNPEKCFDFDILIFFRLAKTTLLEKIISKAKKRNIICCYDIDDYVFDLSIFQYVNPLRCFNHQELSLYFDGVKRYRELLEQCDYFISSTPYLANIVENLKKKSFVIRNGLNHEQEAMASKLLIKPNKRDSNKIQIGYLSGTNTHNKDFAIAESALLRILSEFKNVRLLIRGHLELSDKFDQYSSQIKFLPFIPFEKLIEKMNSLDIIIAPLELNPYNQAKSELKYFEPAIIKKPVIASPTDVFRYAIQNGYNGFLAKSEEDWYSDLKLLISDAKLRKKIGENARNHALSTYGVKAQQKNIANIMNAILDDYFHQTPEMDLGSLNINWIVPCPVSGSGGHRVIFEICQYLTSVGHFVKIYFLPDPHFQNSNQIRDYIKQEFFQLNSEICLGLDDFSVCDALVATAWNTAATAYNYRKMAKKAFYFVQDFEPYFFPMGSDYIAAYSTYSLGLKHITIGNWLTQKLCDEFNAEARSFPFPIDHQIYFPNERRDRQNSVKIAFFARNNILRRCYPLGVEALKLFKKLKPDVEVILFGSNQIDEADFPYKHENLGIITPKELANLYRSCDVGLTFSTTNPSIVPFEMMACGLPVVDLDFNDNHIHYGGHQNISLAQPNPRAIADAIIALIEDEQLWLEKQENGIEYAKNLPNRLEAARMFEEILIDYMRKDN